MKKFGDGRPMPPSEEAMQLLDEAKNRIEDAEVLLVYYELKVREAQASVEDSKNAALELYNSTDLSLQDIADVLNIHNSTVWRRLQARTS